MFVFHSFCHLHYDSHVSFKNSFTLLPENSSLCCNLWWRWSSRWGSHQNIKVCFFTKQEIFLVLLLRFQLSADTNCPMKMNNFLANLPLQKVSIFVSIVVSFTYNLLLDRDVSCTCKPDERACDIYMSLPFLIIFLLILWTDEKVFWSFTYMCPRGRGQQQPVPQTERPNERPNEP